MHYHVFDRMFQRDIVSWNTVIFGYVGCGKMGFEQSVFDSMPERDVVSWNSLISGYLQNDDYCETVDVFVKIQKTPITSLMQQLLIPVLIWLPLDLGSKSMLKLLSCNCNRTCI